MKKLILIFAFSLPLIAQSSGDVGTAKDPVIRITRTGTLYLNEKPANIHGLVANVQSSAAKNVYVRADGEVPWEPVAQVLSALGAAKPPIKVTLVTRPATDKK